MPLKAPLLTFIISSRNDNYAGNSLWRLQTVLCYLGQAAHELNRVDDVEVIINDWGSEVPLKEVIDLSEEAARICRFLEVPLEIAAAAGQGSPFPEVVANNASVRHARGTYIGRIDQDTLVGSGFLSKFFALLDNSPKSEISKEQSFFFVRRKSVPLSFARLNLDFDTVNRFIRVWGKWLPVEGRGLQPWYDAAVGILIMHRDLWEATRGYDETLLYWGFMDADLGLRVESRHQVVRLENYIGCHFYHLRHGLWSFKITTRKKNPRRRDNVFQPNSDDWGLCKHKFPLVRYDTKKRKSGPAIRSRDWGAGMIFFRFAPAILAESIWQLLVFMIRLLRNKH